MSKMNDFLLAPNPSDPRLTERVKGISQDGTAVEISVTVERPLTLYLNGREIVTMMTIGDYPEYLALGYLLNQNMLKLDDEVLGVEYEEDVETVVVRTATETWRMWAVIMLSIKLPVTCIAIKF